MTQPTDSVLYSVARCTAFAFLLQFVVHLIATGSVARADVVIDWLAIGRQGVPCPADSSYCDEDGGFFCHRERGRCEYTQVQCNQDLTVCSDWDGLYCDLNQYFYDSAAPRYCTRIADGLEGAECVPSLRRDNVEILLPEYQEGLEDDYEAIVGDQPQLCPGWAVLEAPGEAVCIDDGYSYYTAFAGACHYWNEHMLCDPDTRRCTKYGQFGQPCRPSYDTGYAPGIDESWEPLCDPGLACQRHLGRRTICVEGGGAGQPCIMDEVYQGLVGFSPEYVCDEPNEPVIMGNRCQCAAPAPLTEELRLERLNASIHGYVNGIVEVYRDGILQPPAQYLSWDPLTSDPGDDFLQTGWALSEFYIAATEAQAGSIDSGTAIHRYAQLGFTLPIAISVDAGLGFSDAQAYITRTTQFEGTPVTVLVVQGSTDLDDWLIHDGLLALSTDLGFVAPFVGFADYASALVHDQELRDAIAEACGDPTHRFWIAGHSLGGAAGQIIASWLVDHAGCEVDGIVTFGSPRPGRDEFHDHYAAQGLSPKTHRFETDQDPVTTLPPLGVTNGRRWNLEVDNGLFEGFESHQMEYYDAALTCRVSGGDSQSCATGGALGVFLETAEDLLKLGTLGCLGFCW